MCIRDRREGGGTFLGDEIGRRLSLSNTAAGLGNIADGQEKHPTVAVFQTGVEIVRGLLGIFQSIEKPLSVGFGTDLWVWHSVTFAGAGSQPIEQQLQSVAHGARCGAAELSDVFHELRLVDSQHLRYVHDASSRQVGLALLQ